MSKREDNGRRELAYADIVVRSFDVEKRTVDYVMSDDTVDSYGEIVEQKWLLDRFKKAPIVLYAHNKAHGNYWGEGTIQQRESFPIGRVLLNTLKVETRKDDAGKRVGQQLVGTVEFQTRELNQFADDVFQQVVTGFMPCGSVGFYPHDVRRETHDDKERYVLSKNELFEFSPCPIGANANAVANSMGSRDERRSYLARRAEECAQTRLGFDEEPEDDIQPAASGQETNTMDEKEFKAKLAELEKVRDAARGSESAAKEAAAAAQKQAAEATERATKAEETRDKATAELDGLKGSVRTIATELGVGDEALKADAAKQCEAIMERATALQDEAIEAELKALVGKKFHPSELEFMKEDRKRVGKEAFTKRMAARPDLTTGQLKVPADPTTSILPEPSIGNDGSKSSAYFNQA
jgi:hypothetical protein